MPEQWIAKYHRRRYRTGLYRLEKNCCATGQLLRRQWEAVLYPGDEWCDKAAIYFNHKNHCPDCAITSYHQREETETIHLCQEGIDLYEQWRTHYERHVKHVYIEQAYVDYMDHRRECSECSKPHGENYEN